MSDKDYTVICENPLIRVDFSRMSLGDWLKLMQNPNYAFALFLKCTVDDLDNISFEFAPQIIQAYTSELSRFIADLANVHEMLKK